MAYTCRAATVAGSTRNAPSRSTTRQSDRTGELGRPPPCTTEARGNNPAFLRRRSVGTTAAPRRCETHGTGMTVGTCAAHVQHHSPHGGADFEMPPAYAETVFTNGPVFTGSDTGIVEGAEGREKQVAVREGRIVAVGAGPRRPHRAAHRARRSGRAAADSGVSGRAHPCGDGRGRAGQCDLSGTVDLDEYRRRLRRMSDANPDAAWITGGGWSWKASRTGCRIGANLDELVPDRPVYLINRDHHAGWVNSRALELAGVTAKRPIRGRQNRPGRRTANRSAGSRRAR